MAGLSTTTHQVIAFEEARAIKRRRRLRIGLPIAVVAVLLAALIGIAVYDFRVMRADALALSEGVIDNLQRRIETEVAAYLEPIPGIVRFTRELLADEAFVRVRRELTEKVATGILNHAPQLVSVIIGNPAGEFFMVRRYHGAQGDGLETKIIHRPEGAAGQPVMQITRRGAAGEVLSDSTEPWDGYDPRERPWYVGAAARKDLFWTDVYPFFTSKAAGITGSVPYLDDSGALVAVVGADIELANLSRFLGTLTIGKTGLALIVDDQGRVIAHPRAGLLTQQPDGELRLLRVADLDDPVITRAFDHYRIEGHGRRDFELAGRRYISVSSSLNHLLERDWSILLIAPEDDFIGFVAQNVRQTLGIGLAVIALAGLLAAAVVRHGLRADRDALRILEREAELDAQGEAFGTLATQADLFDHGSGLTTVTAAVARATGVRRVSLWRLTPTGDALVCLDSFDGASAGHTGGVSLRRVDHPEVFAALAKELAAGEADVADGASLAALHRRYLSPLGCHALLSEPVVAQQRLAGALWLEDGHRASWPPHVRQFARAVANLIALREAAGQLPGTAPPVTTAPQPGPRTTERPAATSGAGPDLDPGLDARRAAAFRAGLAGSSSAGIQASERLAVLALQFSDPQALARPVRTDAEEATFAHLVRQIEAAAAAHGVAYLKILNEQVLAAADPAVEAAQGAAQLADFALSVQGDCEHLFAEQHAPLAFHLGLDLGPVLGSWLGRDGRVFNLWGEALGTAARLAASSPPGAIQASESVYRALHAHYLFQQRGRHYLEGVGEFATYLLSGRL